MKLSYASRSEAPPPRGSRAGVVAVVVTGLDVTFLALLCGGVFAGRDVPPMALIVTTVALPFVGAFVGIVGLYTDSDVTLATIGARLNTALFLVSAVLSCVMGSFASGI